VLRVPRGRASAVRAPVPQRVRRRLAPLARDVPDVPVRPPRAAEPPRGQKRDGGGGSGWRRRTAAAPVVHEQCVAPAGLGIRCLLCASLVVRRCEYFFFVTII
jgi:hypothetical protein